MLHRVFPGDPIVGEEDAADLRTESGVKLRDRIIELANEALAGDLGIGDNAEWGIGPGHAKTPEELLDAIDRGNYAGGRMGSEQFYSLSRSLCLPFYELLVLRDVDNRPNRRN